MPTPITRRLVRTSPAWAPDRPGNHRARLQYPKENIGFRQKAPFRQGPGFSSRISGGNFEIRPSSGPGTYRTLAL